MNLLYVCFFLLGAAVIAVFSGFVVAVFEEILNRIGEKNRGHRKNFFS